MATTNPTTAESEAHGDASTRKEPPIKRRRLKKKKDPSALGQIVKSTAKGRKGRLAFILEAPTEIVLEILSHLNPVDILNLSYADRNLRSMLTSESAQFIWAAARANMQGLPECPPDFTEWGYARFVFVKCCDVCGRLAYGLHNMAYLRVRLCARCKNDCCTNILQSPDVAGLVPVYIPDTDGYSALAYSPLITSQRLKLMDLDTEKKPAYLNERRAFIRKIEDHARRLSTFLDTYRAAKQEAALAIREKRANEIRKRLLALGHDSRDIDEFQRLKHRTMYQTAELTERSWPNVLRQITERLEEIKNQRLEHELRARNKRILSDLFLEMWNAVDSEVDKYAFIPSADFLTLSSVQYISNANPPDDEILTVIASQMPQIWEDIEDFRRHMRRDLVWIMESCMSPRSHRPPWDDYDIDMITSPTTPEADLERREMLSRATSLFMESHSTDARGNPVHYSTLFKSPLPYIVKTFAAQPHLEETWNLYRQCLKYDRDGAGAMAAILEVANLDPHNTSIDEVENLVNAHIAPFADHTWQELIMDAIDDDGMQDMNDIPAFVLNLMAQDDDEDAVSEVGDEDAVSEVGNEDAVSDIENDEEWLEHLPDEVLGAAT